MRLRTHRYHYGISTALVVSVVVVMALAAVAVYYFFGRSYGSGVLFPAEILLPAGVGLNQSLTFAPADVKVVIGVNNTISWTDLDRTATHTVTSTEVPAGANSFDSGNLTSGLKFEATLTVPGTYRYRCMFHPSWMAGTITVVKS